jgi:hypothetical protein
MSTDFNDNSRLQIPKRGGHQQKLVQRIRAFPDDPLQPQNGVGSRPLIGFKVAGVGVGKCTCRRSNTAPDGSK